MKKRLLSLVLVLLVAVSLFSTAAFAAGANTQSLAPNTDVVGTVKDLKGISGDIIVYPKALETTDAKYPVIAWANGTGCITSLYYQLFEKFAEAGYIVIADTNVMAGDGKSLIQSIDYIVGKNADPNSIFYNKVDVDNIGASGHSQGGKGSVCAASKDSRIKCILSIAGASTANEAKDVTCPAFYMTGSADLIVLSSMWVKPSYKASSGPAVYACLKNAPHTTCMFVPGEIAEYGIQWFDAYLKNDGNMEMLQQFAINIVNDSHWKDCACRNY